MAVRVTTYHPYTLTVEGGEIRLRLARMAPAEFDAFRAHFLAMGQGRGAPGDDAALEDQIAYLQKNAEWCDEVFAKYVRVVEGDLVVEGVDGEEIVTDGRRFAALYQAEAPDVLAELYLQNGLTESQKKTLRSARDSGTGSSTAPNPAAHGPLPVTTAANADGEDSAAIGAATALNNGASSGTTGPSCLEPVLSGS